jgi:hypothetical protein
MGVKHSTENNDSSCEEQDYTEPDTEPDTESDTKPDTEPDTKPDTEPDKNKMEFSFQDPYGIGSVSMTGSNVDGTFMIDSSCPIIIPPMPLAHIINIIKTFQALMKKAEEEKEKSFTNVDNARKMMKFYERELKFAQSYYMIEKYKDAVTKYEEMIRRSEAACQEYYDVRDRWNESDSKFKDAQKHGAACAALARSKYGITL